MPSLISIITDTNEADHLGDRISGSSPAQIDAALLTADGQELRVGLATAMVKKGVRIEVIGMIEWTVLSSIRPRSWSS